MPPYLCNDTSKTKKQPFDKTFDATWNEMNAAMPLLINHKG